MGKNLLFTAILVFLIVAGASDAAVLWNFRKLVASSPKEDPNVSPIPSPALGGKQSTPVAGKEKQNQPSPDTTSGVVKSKDKQVVNTPPTHTKEHDNNPEKGEKVKENEKGESKTNVPVGGSESCNGIGRRCQDTKSMVACVQSFDDVSKALVLLIQNKGDSSMKVDLIISSGNKQNGIEIPKLQTKKVNVTLANVGGNTIKLNAGNGDCVLHLGARTSQGNFLQWPPSYSKFMTPIYGAYFLLLTTIIAGGAWACCWFKKRGRQTDIPYQELEMSMPESAAAAAAVESAEGWDDDWDDDWDEEKAVKSPGGQNISANGLTSRIPKKEGWEDWDD